MKKLLIILATLAFIVGVGVMKAEAAETADITVTVTLQSLSVAITAPVPATWVLGVVGVGSTSGPLSCTAKNDGNAAENFGIKVGTCTPTGWTPAAAADANKFVMTVDAAGIPIVLTGSDQTLQNNVTATSVRNFTLTFKAPTSTTVPNTPETIPVTVTATSAL